MMAITPRTILSRPINLVVFSLAGFALAAVLGALLGAYSTSAPKPAQKSAHRTAIPATPPPGTVARKAGLPQRAPCQLLAPQAAWTGAQWARHLSCMEARHAPVRVLLGEVNLAIRAAGLAPELALKKSDYLARTASLDAQIAFLQTAVDRLGVVDGQLVHRLNRALIWRGRQADLEQIHQLQLLSKMLEPDDFSARCEFRQTDLWARMMTAQSARASAAPHAHLDPLPAAARRSVQRAVRNYVAQGCARQIHQGQWNALAEVVGAAIAAEATNGHTGQSSLVRQVAESYRIQNVPEFCRAAVPAGLGLREVCEKRVADELYLAH